MAKYTVARYQAQTIQKAAGSLVPAERMVKMYNFEFKSIPELVKLGREGGREKIAKYLNDVQAAIGEGNEFHPDWMDTIFDACEELEWDTEKFIEWMWG